MEDLERLFFEKFLKREDRAYDEKNHTIESLHKLGINEKLQIGTALLGDLNHDKSEKHKHLENVIGKLSMQLQAADMRLMDLEKDACSFKRDVLTNTTCSVGSSASVEGDYGSTTVKSKNGKGGESGTTTKIVTKNAITSTTASNISSMNIKSEKILRHFQSRSLLLDSTKDKLKLQQTDQKNKLQKIESKLKQKNDSGSNFDYIDFHKFQSDNKQYKKELNTATSQLEQIKVLYEKSEKKLAILNEVLEKYEKQKLSSEKSVDLRRRHLQRLQDKVQSQKDNIEAISSDQDKINNCGEMKTDEDENDSNKNVDVMDIVDQQSQLYELQSLIKTWSRKVEIAQLANKNKKCRAHGK